METLQASEVTNARHLLAEKHATRTAEILDQQQPPLIANVNSEDGNDSNSPIFHSFYAECGSPAIVKMTTFSLDNILKHNTDISDDI